MDNRSFCLVQLCVEINPWFYQGRKTALAKPKRASLMQAQTRLINSKTSKYNSKGLASALLKYKEDLTNENK